VHSPATPWVTSLSKFGAVSDEQKPIQAAKHTVRSVCADFMALQNHGSVFDHALRAEHAPGCGRASALQ
jgi:hypothetical protein